MWNISTIKVAGKQMIQNVQVKLIRDCHSKKEQ
jgi:hypothetical protein